MIHGRQLASRVPVLEGGSHHNHNHNDEDSSKMTETDSPLNSELEIA